MFHVKHCSYKLRILCSKLLAQTFVCEFYPSKSFMDIFTKENRPMFHVKHGAVQSLNQQQATVRGDRNRQLAVPGEEFFAAEQIICSQGFPGDG